jgi:hypothetical protein
MLQSLKFNRPLYGRSSHRVAGKNGDHMFGYQNVVVMVGIYSILAYGEQGNEIKRSISNGTAAMIAFQERIHQIGVLIVKFQNFV